VAEGTTSRAPLEDSLPVAAREEGALPFRELYDLRDAALLVQASQAASEREEHSAQGLFLEQDREAHFTQIAWGSSSV